MLVMVHQAWRAEEDVGVAWCSGPGSTPSFTAVMARGQLPAAAAAAELGFWPRLVVLLYQHGHRKLGRHPLR